MKRFAAALIVVTASTAAALVGCSKGEAAKDAPPAGGRGGRGARGAGAGMTFAVDVMPIEAKKLNYVVTAPGTIDALEHVQVVARVAGAVDKVAFTEGQQVKKGDTLVIIEGARFGVAVKSAQAAYQKTLAQLSEDQAEVARREGATKDHPGLIPGEELDTYKTKTITSKADADVALEALHTAQLNMRDSAVRAPMDGVIQTRTVETGQYVSAGYVMATLLRVDPMLLRFSVEPQDAARLKPGMKALFTLRETQQQYASTISLVAGAADLTTHLVPVTATVDDTGHKFWLRPGDFADVEIDVGAARESPVIPRIAVRATDHGYVAYVINGDTAQERVLNLGMNTKDGWVEVRTGLAAGEQLVVHGGEALQNGTKVKANPVTAESLIAAMASAQGTSKAAPPIPPSGMAAPSAAPAGSARSGRPRAAASGAAPAAPVSVGSQP